MNTVIVACPSCAKKNRFPASKQHLRPKFKNGSLIDQVTGAVARDVLEQKLRSA